MKIETNRVVAIHYELKNESGEMLDSSSGREPLTYLHGTGAIIPGLERELEGKVAGDELTALIAPDDAYGQSNENLIRNVPKSVFADVEPLETGMQFQVSNNDGSPQVITVVEVGEEEVKVNGNHPLAGVTLDFSVRVESVRDATSAEIEHGHAH